MSEARDKVEQAIAKLSELPSGDELKPQELPDFADIAQKTGFAAKAMRMGAVVLGVLAAVLRRHRRRTVRPRRRADGKRDPRGNGVHGPSCGRLARQVRVCRVLCGKSRRARPQRQHGAGGRDRPRELHDGALGARRLAPEVLRSVFGAARGLRLRGRPGAGRWRQRDRAGFRQDARPRRVLQRLHGRLPRAHARRCALYRCGEQPKPGAPVRGRGRRARAAAGREGPVRHRRASGSCAQAAPGSSRRSTHPSSTCSRAAFSERSSRWAIRTTVQTPRASVSGYNRPEKTTRGRMSPPSLGRV